MKWWTVFVVDKPADWPRTRRDERSWRRSTQSLLGRQRPALDVSRCPSGPNICLWEAPARVWSQVSCPVGEVLQQTEGLLEVQGEDTKRGLRTNRRSVKSIDMWGNDSESVFVSSHNLSRCICAVWCLKGKINKWTKNSLLCFQVKEIHHRTYYNDFLFPVCTTISGTEVYSIYDCEGFCVTFETIFYNQTTWAM